MTDLSTMTTMSTISIDVVGELAFDVHCSMEALERDTLRLMDVLESDASGLAIGPCVACSFQRSSIDVRFGVEGATEADVQQRIAKVARLIADATDARLRIGTVASGHSELACA